MDLLQTVRKEGSRGGVNFSWDDVKSSQHRENYLGHSLMAPVGRWQKNKDLSWYAKADDADLSPEELAEKQRLAKREELRKVKEAEEDAMAKALGLPPPDRSANTVPLGLGREEQGEVNRALKEALGDEEEQPAEKKRNERRGEKDGARRRRSRSRERERRRDVGEREHRHRRRSRSRSRSPRRRAHRSRSREPERRSRRYEDHERRDDRHARRPSRERHVRRRSRSRSRSTHEKRRHRDER